MLKISTVTVGFSLLIAGCGGEAGELDDGPSVLGRVEQPSLAFDFADWSRRPMPLTVCTKRINTSNDPLSAASFTTYRGWLMNTLVLAWDIVPGIDIVDGGNCTAAPSGGLMFEIRGTASIGGMGGQCWVGDSMCYVTGTESTAGTEALMRLNAAHEFAHGLGLAHEHNMVGATLCTREQDILNACTNCLADFNGGSPCAVADLNGCLGLEEAADRMLVDTEPASANGRIIDRTPDPDAESLTPYDGRSLMDYCKVENGRDPSDFMPTPFDLLGAEMLYADNRAYPLGCHTGCFHNATGVIVRADGVLTSPWKERGALNILLQSGSSTQGAASLPSGTSSLTLRFFDPRGTLRTASGMATKSNGLHAAMVSTLFASLL